MFPGGTERGERWKMESKKSWEVLRERERERQKMGESKKS